MTTTKRQKAEYNEDLVNKLWESNPSTKNDDDKRTCTNIQLESKEIKYTITEEPISRDSIEWFLQYTAARNATDNRGSLWNQLYWIWLRIRSKDDGTHYIVVVYIDIPVFQGHDGKPGKLGRQYSGINNVLDDKPIPEISDVLYRDLYKGVPRSQLGKSVFAFSKMIKYICREGLGIGEIDLFEGFCTTDTGEGVTT